MDYLLLGLIAFGVTLIGTWSFARLARRWDMGQYIRDYGPEIHVKKEGTPTMGGTVIVITFALLVLLAWFWRSQPSPQAMALCGATIGFGAIGLVDDLIGIFKKRSLGLPIRYKLLLQLLLGIALFWGLRSAGAPSAMKVPFAEVWIELPPVFYAVLVVSVLLGTANAVNLTDGLDGLATGVSLIVLFPFLWFLRGEPELLQLAVIFGGALLGFLWFNAYPARVFLGDVGSLALGGFIATLALLSGTALILPLLAGVLVIEALSVILQVASFQWFGVRIFKVAPLHHHFEHAEGVDYRFLLPNREWPEPGITIRFWITAIIFVLLGLGAFIA
jgi:phospho-N-acetylmuramoyl-pentapeptide-transferase